MNGIVRLMRRWRQALPRWPRRDVIRLEMRPADDPAGQSDFFCFMMNDGSTYLVADGLVIEGRRKPR